jgi:hypothetical protein
MSTKNRGQTYKTGPEESKSLAKNRAMKATGKAKPDVPLEKAAATDAADQGGNVIHGNDEVENRCEQVVGERGFKQSREGCYSGYIDMRDIKASIPELDLLKEWKDLVFSDDHYDGKDLSPGGRPYAKHVEDTIQEFRDWHDEAKKTVCDHIEAAVSAWVTGPDKEQSAIPEDETTIEVLAMKDKVIEELSIEVSEMTKIIGAATERGEFIRNAQLRAWDHLVAEEQKYFMNDTWKQEIVLSLFTDVPCPTKEEANAINIAKYEGFFIWYMRVRAKLIDRYGLSVPSVNLDSKPTTFYHRLWNAGEQITIAELSERNKQARAERDKAKAIDTADKDKGITIAKDKAVAVPPKDGNKSKAKTSTNATTKVNKTVGAVKKSAKKQVADSPGSLKEFLKNDDESESIVDETNSDNDADSYDEDDQSFSATDEEGSSYHARDKRSGCGRDRPARKAAKKGIVQRRVMQSDNRLNDLMIDHFFQSGGGTSMTDYRKLTLDQLEALKVAVIDELVEKASISTNDVRSMSGLPSECFSTHARGRTSF